ncbi:acyl-CoA dehydrogenase family protein [Pseudonocardia lutea]|uniref:Acyl-CoA dehydrogenase family protein n=1 Tax=Pseudonocardia lutea TaxID=2172015 RepID=A0ABW1I3J3_9PSEU
MPAHRLLPSAEAEAFVDRARRFAQEELRTRAAEEQPGGLRAVLGRLGELGLLGMPYPRQVGGAGLPYEVYLQALEEISGAWAGVGLGISVHTASCQPLATWGTPAQIERWLGEMLSGAGLGGYCLSEVHAGSDPAAIRSRAHPVEDGYEITGSKAWVTHGGEAGFYTVFARTSDDRTRGISCFLVPADSPGIGVHPPDRKMGMAGPTTATVDFDSVWIGSDRLVGGEGRGLQIALEALDSGRLGIAAVAVGLAQSALDHSVSYAKDRRTFGKPIIEHQGLGFLLADMAAAVAGARGAMLDAARRRDRGLPFAQQAAIAKLLATDAAMRVTTDAVQVHGALGYTAEFPVERQMREAKALQILEGTNQIQRMVIARHLSRSA